MSARECIQEFTPNLFWDTRLESIDLEANAPYVVQRVLEYGQLNDWHLIVSYYGMERIGQISIGLRTLESKALSFVSLVTSIPIESFRCYTLKLSSPKHWDY